MMKQEMQLRIFHSFEMFCVVDAFTSFPFMYETMHYSSIQWHEKVSFPLMKL